MRLLRSAALTVSIPVALLGAAAATAADGDLATAPPREVLAQVKADLAKVKSYRLAGTTTEKGTVARISADVTISGGARLSVREGKAAIRMVLLRNAVYLNGNLAYWQRVGGKGQNAKAVARKLAGRWVKDTDQQGKGLDSVLDGLTPKDLASCIDVNHGTLTNEGAQTLGGRKVVVLRDAGDKPGTSPGLLYVAAEGPALPVRIKQTGPRKAGGKLSAKCDDKEDKSTAGDMTFSRFDAIGKIAAPRGARTVEDLVGGSLGTPV